MLLGFLFVLVGFGLLLITPVVTLRLDALPGPINAFVYPSSNVSDFVLQTLSFIRWEQGIGFALILVGLVFAVFGCFFQKE